MLKTYKLSAFFGDRSGQLTVPGISLRYGGYPDVLDSVVNAGMQSVLLVDCRGVNDLQRCDMALSVAESRTGLEAGSIKIVASVDSAAGLLRLADLGGKSLRLAGLAWNGAAFSADIGYGPDSPIAEHGRLQVVIAARAFGLPAYDCSGSDSTTV